MNTGFDYCIGTLTNGFADLIIFKESARSVRFVAIVSGLSIIA